MRNKPSSSETPNHVFFCHKAFIRGYKPQKKLNFANTVNMGPDKVVNLTVRPFKDAENSDVKWLS